VILLSFLAVGLALALVRQIPAEVQVASAMGDLVPMASLFGLGLGLVLQGRRSLSWLFPAGLALVFAFVFLNRGVLVDEVPEGVLFLLRDQALPVPHLRPPLPPVAAAATLFTCVVPAFVAVGQALARALDGPPRLVALGRVLVGALAAAALHGPGARLGLPPWVVVCGLAGLAALVLARGRWQRGVLLATGLAFLLFGRSPLPGQWSPYALVQHLATPSGGVIFADATFQDVVLDAAGDIENSRRSEALARARWRRPHELFREVHGRGPESVLILGSGAGNDVAAALDQGVLRVVAVEIDPVILEVGRRLHGSSPHSDPRVEQVLDDPRHFLRTCRETFDLVVFGTLNRRAAPTGEPLLPRRSFGYTREAFEDARRRLVEGGLLAVHGPAGGTEVLSRVHEALRSVFDGRSRVIDEGNRAPLGATLVASGDLDPPEGDPGTVVGPTGGALPTDEWPYLGGRPYRVEPVHLRLLGVVAVLVLGVLLVLHRVRPVSGLHVDYLLLGLGLAVLGSVASARVALVFGRTWLAGTTALSAALALLLLANSLVLRRRAPSLSLAWTGLLGLVLLDYLVPASLVSSAVSPSQTAVVGLLLGATVLCAGLCFSLLYGGEATGGPPLGVALVGAMAGGLLGHVSVVTGMRSAWLLALAVLALAGLAARLVQRPPVAS
jgi:hypothetical protein